MPNHCSTSQTSLHCLLGNQHRESVKKSCEGTWLDDAAQLWTTGVNVGSQVKKKEKKARRWGSFISCQSEYKLPWRNVFNSYFSFSANLLHITPAGRSGFCCCFLPLTVNSSWFKCWTTLLWIRAFSFKHKKEMRYCKGQVIINERKKNHSLCMHNWYQNMTGWAFLRSHELVFGSKIIWMFSIH